MAFKIYSKYKPKPCGRSSSIRLCHISRKYSFITFNARAFRDLGMKKGMRMLFAQDTDTANWFFAFGDAANMKDGSLLRPQIRKGKVTSFKVQNKVVIDKICKEVKADRAVFNISMHPKRERGREWYRILTTTPYRIDEY